MHACLSANPHIDRITDTGLPEAWLVAGCLAQTVWNLQAGHPPDHGIADYDLVYFDPSDLSAETEAAHEARLRARFGLKLDVKNQARVHLWYEAKFGRAIPPYRSVEEAIATYPTTATAIGLRLADRSIYAPFGTDDLVAGIIRANRFVASREVFEKKAKRWQGLWPHLHILDWSEGTPNPNE